MVNPVSSQEIVNSEQVHHTNKKSSLFVKITHILNAFWKSSCSLTSHIQSLFKHRSLHHVHGDDKKTEKAILEMEDVAKVFAQNPNDFF